MLNPQQNKKLLQKLSHCLEVFEPYLFEPQGKLDYRMFETREHLRAVPPDECFHAPVPHWGGPWQTCWFKGRYQPSEQLAGRALYLMPRVGGYEAMLWVDGMPKGTFATKIVVTRHGNHYCDNCVTSVQKLCSCYEPYFILIKCVRNVIALIFNCYFLIDYCP